MKVVYIGIFKNDAPPAHELAAERDLSSYGRFTRGTISEFMTFSGGAIAQRTPPGKRQDVEENNHIFHVYAHSSGVCGVVITDLEYPKLVAHSLLSKVVDEFTNKYPRTAYATFEKGSPQMAMPELKDYIVKYQDPAQADNISKIQKELDETKIVLHKTIESVLERGEKIDNLVAKSDGLSAQSKMFYTQAKKQNSCCNVM
ncbi:palmitoyltransferase [Pleosporales sp. CAS-2024a]